MLSNVKVLLRPNYDLAKMTDLGVLERDLRTNKKFLHVLAEPRYAKQYIK